MTIIRYSAIRHLIVATEPVATGLRCVFRVPDTARRVEAIGPLDGDRPPTARERETAVVLAFEKVAKAFAVA